jgi:hypothetical protein
VKKRERPRNETKCKEKMQRVKLVKGRPDSRRPSPYSVADPLALSIIDTSDWFTNVDIQ